MPTKIRKSVNKRSRKIKKIRKSTKKRSRKIRKSTKKISRQKLYGGVLSEGNMLSEIGELNTEIEQHRI